MSEGEEDSGEGPLFTNCPVVLNAALATAILAAHAMCCIFLGTRTNARQARPWLMCSSSAAFSST